MQSQERIFAEHLGGVEEATFVILINCTSVSIRKKRSSLTSKARREASEISLWKMAFCPTELKVLQKSIVARIVREPGLDLLNLSEID